MLANGVRSAASKTMQERTTPALSAVIRIDVDVILGQIAGPEGCRSFAFTSNPEDDRDIGVVETNLHIGFVERSSKAVTADLHILQGDIDLGGIEVHAGITGGRENTAPVGIGTGDGGLYEQRIGDGPGDASGRRVTERAVHFDGDQFARAFAIAYDLAGERLESFSERFLEKAHLLGVRANA